VLRDAAGLVLKEEPAVAPLLTLLDAAGALAEDPEARVENVFDPDEVVGLLTGRYGMASALHVRRLRQDLLAAERGRGGRRTSDALL
ncbi:hypothetical protein GUG96_18490, partial [Xanthomonas citri pv. citri]|nr:hypothetical protein [Xanthomonas citri pv. citri]